MARIVVLQHPSQRGVPLHYMLAPMAELWRGEGHDVVVHFGAREAPPGDLAILHVDLTVVPPPLRAALAQYPRVVNGAVLDISKRVVSRNLVDSGSDWAGPVIVKTDANSGGDPERRVHETARRRGFTPAMPEPPRLRQYAIHDSLRHVPDAVWRTPGLVVEKFLPERDPKGFVTRVWTFLGDRERCRRCVAAEPVVKARGIVEREPCEVPEALRARRAELGFDYGKFDFVIHDGECVLLDVARTPTHPQGVPVAEGPVPVLAPGLAALLR